ncbi:two-component system sensor histidine kinase DesK [Lentzea flaviverrucosa]|uniref:Two-component system, NarL family, sensor histidine kinase DesK n=1 Tax=Lentzea flaviverrucosa TaxID=200379 RepID=A0A1H9XL57_9PSEU|nr:two-component system sensor histidine kinase DesK [Lentzea flaviverrucosa]SES46831.1 two-component system, NarL family, sensor histidine kinase DesK [Lentzea flaviverrucosa]
MNASPAIPRYRAIIVAVFAAVCLTDLTRALLLAGEVTELAVSVIDLAVLVLLQVSYFRPLSALRRHLALAAQAALLVLPYVLFGHSWAGVAGLVAGNALLVLRPVFGWSIFVLTVVATGLAQAVHGEAMMATAATALLLAGLATGFATHRDWPAAPGLAPSPAPAAPEIAVPDITVTTTAAVTAERVRVARDLHDLLGYSLSAIKLKSELAHRIVADRPDHGWEFMQEHITDILDITHHALADVRSLARAYRPLSLADTSDSAKAMLAASNIDVRVELAHDPLPEPIETVLAAVLCEAVTNVLRHSDASTCTIGVHQLGATILLDVINDGAAARPVSADCNGVRNQAERVKAAGGTFTARHIGDGSFHVHAAIPAAAPKP